MATLGIDIGCISVKMALGGSWTRRPCWISARGGMAYTRDSLSTRRPPGVSQLPAPLLACHSLPTHQGQPGSSRTGTADSNR